MRVGDIFISGIGVFLPEIRDVAYAVEQGLLSAGAVEALGFTGVAVAGDRPAPEMALSAARDALDNGGVRPDEVTLLLYADVWHQGPLVWQPQFYLQRHLVGDGPLALEIKHGCVGALSGMELAVGHLRADDQHGAALVVASDNFGTPLIDRWTMGAGLTALGDGAAAAVLTRDPGFAQILSLRTASHSAMEETWRAGEPMFPPAITVGRQEDFVVTHERFKEGIRPGDHAALSIVHLQRNMDCVKLALAEAEVSRSDIRRVITHNMPQEEARTYLATHGFSLEESAWEFGRTVGHVGASDQLLSLHHLLGAGALEPGDHVLLCGQSPGMTYKAAVVKILDVPPGG
jgi:3-oxoacyl-[acyl-carrier-protein] synthase-3/clorobiocin biosynthesis protein CloN2